MENLHRCCGFCKGPLPANRETYCSTSCLAEGLKKWNTCNVCGITYQPIRKGSKFCTLKCFNNSRTKASRNVPLPESVPGAKWIPLTQGKFALVDDEDFDEINHYKWCAVKVAKRGNRDIFYAKNTVQKIYMHRSFTHLEEYEEIDHFDGDTLNNRKSNLRIVSKLGNSYNRKISDRNKSGFKGVATTESDTYSVRLSIQYKMAYIGTFSSPEEAAKAYDSAVRMRRGNLGTYNFPEIGERSAITGAVRTI